MQLVTQVRLNRAERRLLEQRALPHIGIGCSDAEPDRDPRTQPREERIRALRHLASGDAVPRSKVNEVLLYLRAAIRAAREQAEPDWWMHAMGDPRGPEDAEDAAILLAGETVRDGFGARQLVGLVRDPAQFAQDMAANRHGQARELEEAWLLVQSILAAMPMPEQFDEDADVLGALQDGVPPGVLEQA